MVTHAFAAPGVYHVRLRVKDNSGHFGVTDPDHFGVPIAIAAMAGDQQAATFGQAIASTQANYPRRTQLTAKFLF